MAEAITGGGLARPCGGSGICFMPGNPLEWKRWRGGIPPEGSGERRNA